MIKVCYSELDGPKGLSLRLEAAGHAGYAPAGQDIVCAGASTLMQALVYLLAGEESARSDAWDEPEGPRLAVAAQAPVAPWVQGAFELAKAGFTLLAERYPDNLRFADVSRSGQQSMMEPAAVCGRGSRPRVEPGADPAGSGCGYPEAGSPSRAAGGTSADPDRAGAAAGNTRTAGAPDAAASADAGAEHGAQPARPLGGRGSGHAPQPAGL